MNEKSTIRKFRIVQKEENREDFEPTFDDERLKKGGSILTEKYFDELFERIREIRLSERRFYQKITDIYATSIDYDKTSKTILEFFIKVQNKLHFAICF